MNFSSTLSTLTALALAGAACASAQDAPTFTKIVYRVHTQSLGLEPEQATLTIEDPTSTSAKVTLIGSRGAGQARTLSYELDEVTQHALIRLASRVVDDRHQAYTTALGRADQPLTYFTLAVEGADGKVRGGDGYRNHMDSSHYHVGLLLSLLDSIRYKAAVVPFATRERQVRVTIVPSQDPTSSETFVRISEGHVNVTSRLRPAAVVEELRAFGDGATVTLIGRSLLAPESTEVPFLVESYRLQAPGINQALGGN